MKSVVLEMGRAVGRTVRQIQQWKARGRVPYRWRLPMLKEAAARLVPLSEADFEWERVPKRSGGPGANEARSHKASLRGRRKGRTAGAGVNQ